MYAYMTIYTDNVCICVYMQTIYACVYMQTTYASVLCIPHCICFYTQIMHEYVFICRHTLLNDKVVLS